MAKYDVECADQIAEDCEGTFKVQLYGKHDKREWKLENYDWTCDTCKEEKRRRKNAESAEANAERGLPELDGSEKQVPWAETIRAGRMDDLDEFEEEIHEAETPEPEHEEMQRLALEKLQAVRHETDAGWWIDTRDDYDFCRRRILKPAKKAHQRGERAWEDVEAFVDSEVEGDPADLGPADLMDLCEAWQERTGADAERAERVVNCVLFDPPEHWQRVGPFA